MVSAGVMLSVVAALAWLLWLAADVGARVATARWVGLVALALVPVWLLLVAYYAPIEAVQGIIQKIFYVHIPAIIPTYFGFILSALGGILYLRTRQERWDQLAVAGAEVGVVFCTLMLVVGPIWAKPAWGHWWVWDLRLTTTLMLWFIYVAYLFLRSFAFGSDTAKTFTAVYGIAGIAAIPFVYFAVDLAQGSTMHPSNPSREGLPPEMGRTVGVGMLTFIWIFAWLVAKRLELAALQARALVASRVGGA
jgi:heme exporter protein C